MTDKPEWLVDQPKGVGDNSIAADELKLLVERVERIAVEQKALADDKKDVFSEAKARGYDPRTMRKVIVIRKLDKQIYAGIRSLEDAYLAALGML